MPTKEDVNQRLDHFEEEFGSEYSGLMYRSILRPVDKAAQQLRLLKHTADSKRGDCKAFRHPEVGDIDKALLLARHRVALPEGTVSATLPGGIVDIIKTFVWQKDQYNEVDNDGG